MTRRFALSNSTGARPHSNPPTWFLSPFYAHRLLPSFVPPSRGPDLGLSRLLVGRRRSLWVTDHCSFNLARIHRVPRVYCAQRDGNITRGLLGLPSGLHFRRSPPQWLEKENSRWITELVSRCSDTLECLDIRHPFSIFVLVLHWNRDLPSSVGGSGPAPIDFSKVTKPKDVVFRPGSRRVEWVVTTLQTITPKH